MSNAMEYNTEGKTKKKKKRKAPIIILIIVVVLVAAAGYVWTTQKNNIEALISASGSSEEDIARQIEEQDAKTQETFSSLAGTELRALTEEEAEMLKNGEITEEEAIALIMGETDSVGDNGDVSEGTAVGASSGSGTDDEQSTSVDTASSNVSSLVAKAYVLKAEFSSEIDALISQGYAEVASLSAEERTTAKKLELVQKYSALGSSLESSCDAKMEALLSELEAEIERTGGDMGTVSEIRSSYEQEKSLKKAELISKYN